MYKKAISLIMVGLILITPGCGKTETASPASDEETAVDYIKAQGYEIIFQDGEIERYILDKQLLSQNPYSGIWSVQPLDPDHYLGAEIVSYGFVVDHHPLEELYSSIYEKNNQTVELDTNVVVMLNDGSVIGGYSAPKRKDNVVMAGGAYSLDGKDLETITGLSYAEWREEWQKKYGNFHQ